MIYLFLMLFDTHTHTQLDAYDRDREQVMRRARDAQIWMMQVGVDYASSQKAIALAHQYEEGVYASVGLHPNDVSADIDFALYTSLAVDSKVRAIGETGLDYYRTIDEEKRALQKLFFVRHMTLARQIEKPLIIHCRDVHEEVLQILQEQGEGVRGVAHFFTGTREQAEKYIALGFFISFSGVVTFTTMYDAVVRSLPMDRILIETDAPFVAPVPYRGKRNEPFFLLSTVQKIAALKNISEAECAAHTTANARLLFRV